MILLILFACWCLGFALGNFVLGPLFVRWLNSEDK